MAKSTEQNSKSSLSKPSKHNTNAERIKEMEKLLKILKEINPDVDFEGRTDLFESGDLDSMSIVMLASEINDEFDVELKVTDIIPENFNSPEAIMAMIEKLAEED